MHKPAGRILKTIETSEIIAREAEWGEMNVSHETYKKRFDLAPLLKGLPNDRCQCPHWGYIVKGSMRVRYADHSELIKAGEAYYTTPGHVETISAGTELIEFSPKDKLAPTMKAIERNLAAMSGKGKWPGAKPGPKASAAGVRPEALAKRQVQGWPRRMSAPK